MGFCRERFGVWRILKVQRWDKQVKFWIGLDQIRQDDRQLIKQKRNSLLIGLKVCSMVLGAFWLILQLLEGSWRLIVKRFQLIGLIPLGCGSKMLGTQKTLLW